MGGRPLLAMNVVCFPECERYATTKTNTRGRTFKVTEAGHFWLRHTVDDNEPKYGLAVAGLVHPDKVISNNGARPEILFLTKPLGNGVIATTIAGMASGSL